MTHTSPESVGNRQVPRTFVRVLRIIARATARTNVRATHSHICALEAVPRACYLSAQAGIAFM